MPAYPSDRDAPAAAGASPFPATAIPGTSAAPAASAPARAGAGFAPGARSPANATGTASATHPAPTSSEVVLDGRQRDVHRGRVQDDH
jgi:hypothetical protein